ncbi:MAG: DUF4363 family protein [Clostridia bacterium]|nr:DUF4363 family protein [Clostridia bacterium]
MKKELVAATILVLIAVCGIINISVVIKTTGTLIGEIEQAEKLLFSGDKTGAEKAVGASLEEWLKRDKYSHIMLRHDDVDNVTEAYYELLTGIQSGAEARALFASLNERLERLAEIEQPKLSSIF